MDKIEKLLSPEYKPTITEEIQKAMFSDISNPEERKTAEIATEMIIKIYVHGYKKGYEQAQSEVLELDRKTN